MEECIFVHPENVKAFVSNHQIVAAVIARPNDYMKYSQVRHVIVETERGVHTRCYLAKHNGINFLIIYGRFDRVRKTSIDINYVLTQEAISFLGIKTVVGTFVVGSINENDRAGTVYIPHDYVGLGGFHQSRNLETGFRNVDMFEPFCRNLRDCLSSAADSCDFAVNLTGVYACFHGYPRIETAAELKYYQSMGWDVVGQTLDPEATLAREAGCHYAALAVTIDDHVVRAKFAANDPGARDEIDSAIANGRIKTFQLFLNSLEAVQDNDFKLCSCARQAEHVKTRSKHFYYRPSYLL